MKLILALLASATLAGCTSSDDAYRALQGAGYRDIQITGYAFFGCDDKDTFHTGFKAIGQDGSHVAGVVCAGLFKG